VGNYIKLPENNIGSLKNVEETEEFTKTVSEKHKKV
jgi:hypothetical protein